jgi:hypothetical protein
MADSVLCFVRGRGSVWEALCLDFDIAVQGASFDDVMSRMRDAVRTYVEDAEAESPEVARQLLNRRAPLWVRVKFMGSYLFHLLRRSRRDGDGDYRAGFDLPCHA